MTASVAFLVAVFSAGLMALRNRGAGPSILPRQVAFTTNPTGCEITVARIDSYTGEPDPTRIQTARGKKTTLTISFEAGDYLAVAVLPETQLFHEVYRHVPKRDETTTDASIHLNWTLNPSGDIEVPKIELPRPDVTVEMGFCQ